MVVHDDNANFPRNATCLQTRVFIDPPSYQKADLAELRRPGNSASALPCVTATRVTFCCVDFSRVSWFDICVLFAVLRFVSFVSGLSVCS